jgi:hypothetical protein
VRLTSSPTTAPRRRSPDRTGRTGAENVDLVGFGEINAGGLAAQDANVSAGGTGTATVNAAHTLRAAVADVGRSAESYGATAWPTTATTTPTSPMPVPVPGNEHDGPDGPG